MTIPEITRSFLAALDEPVWVVRRYFRVLYPTALIGGLLAALPTVVSELLAARTPDDPVRQAMLTYAAAGIGLLLFLPTQVAIYAALRFALEGRPVTVMQAYAFALSLPRLFAMLCAALLVIAGMVCCCVPGIVAWVLIALTPAVLVHESRGPLESLSRSVELTTYRPPGHLPTWMRTAGVWVVTSAIQAALSTIAVVPLGILQVILLIRAAAEGQALSPEELSARTALISAVLTVAGAAVGAIGEIYASAAYTGLFRLAREQREGTELRTALSARHGAATS